MHLHRNLPLLAAVAAVALPSSADAASRAFSPDKQRARVLTFHLDGVTSNDIRRAKLVQGNSQRAVKLATVKAAARRGVLRIRPITPRAASKLVVTTRATATLRKRKYRPVAPPPPPPPPPSDPAPPPPPPSDPAPPPPPPSDPAPPPPPPSDPAPPAPSTKSVNIAAGSILPTDAQAAAKVRRSTWEPRPQNYTANHRVPTATELSVFRATVGTGSRLPAYNDRITGNFTGTTDEIIQWAAWKWGVDEDIIRAAAVNESGWDQATAADVVNGTAYSFGIMQIKRPHGQQYNGWEGTFPLSKVSTAFNVDFFGAALRCGIDGYQRWMLSRWPNMNNADVWGWVGSWYSGQWYDAGAVSYITSAKRHLANRRWETL